MKSFQTQADLGLVSGQSVVVTDPANAANTMVGTVASYNRSTGALVVNVSSAAGPGGAASWAITAAGPNAFHLRPGVEIDGTPSSANPTGMLTIAGDIDLSGFRYGPGANGTGAGEPGVLVIRAGGNLDIVGSISDGFENDTISGMPSTTDNNGWLIQAGLQAGSVETLLPIVLNGGTTFPNTPGLSLRYTIPIIPSTINANVSIPAQVTLSAPITLPPGTRLTAPIYAADGVTVLYPAGTVFSAATDVPMSAQLAAGSVLPVSVGITAMMWPAGANLGVFTTVVTLDTTGVTVPVSKALSPRARVS